MTRLRVSGTNVSVATTTISVRIASGVDVRPATTRMTTMSRSTRSMYELFQASENCTCMISSLVLNLDFLKIL